jgi:hypothetical protein
MKENLQIGIFEKDEDLLAYLKKSYVIPNRYKDERMHLDLWGVIRDAIEFGYKNSEK